MDKVICKVKEMDVFIVKKANEGKGNDNKAQKTSDINSMPVHF
jgi:hypothetical protein